MGLVTTDAGVDVLGLELTEFRVGAWVANVLFAVPNPLSGKVTLSVGDGQTFVGTIDRGGEFEDTDRTRVVAGANGMAKPATPKQYQTCTVRIVLADLLADAGETLSTTASQAVLAAAVESWTTSAEPIGPVISRLMETAGGGALWRMLPDGTVWVGTETWPDSGLDPADYQVLDKRFEDGSWMVSTDEAATCQLHPGTTFEGQRVSMVIHRVEGQEPGPRTRVWFADAGEASQDDRLTAAFAAIVIGSRAPTVDYRAHYRARVVAQSGSKVHVEPEIAGTLPDMGSLPLFVGLPGVSVDGVQAGSVLVGWRGGDRSKAYALCFDTSCQVQTMVLAVLAQLSLGGAGAPPAVTGAHQGAEATMVGALISAFSGLAAACTAPPLSALAAGFGAVGTALTAFQTAASGANNFLSTKVGIAP